MHRLDHVVVEARLSRLRLVRGEAVAGDGDELDPPSARSGADAPGDLVAIEARQSHVHEGRVRLHSQDALDTGRAVACLVRVVRVHMYEHPKGLSGVGVVLDDGYS